MDRLQCHRGSERRHFPEYFLAEQHGHWQEQGQQSVFESAAQDEVHVAVAQDTKMSRAEMRTRIGAVENQAEQTWTSHQITILKEMTSIAGDALENQRRSLLNEATAELQRQSHEHLQEYQQSVQRQLSEVQQ